TVSGSITVSGVASDGLSMTSVQVSVDGGTFANASGTANWTFALNTNSLANGAHSLAAKVTDSGGSSATSALVDVTVNNAGTSSDCTLYAAPSGSDANSGTSPTAPKSFSGAAAATQPGSVVCLLGGTYNLASSFSPSISGSPSSWIVYKNYDATPVNFVWTGAANASAMFYFGGGSFPSNPAYLEFRGLNLNGQGNAADGFFCRGAHHLRFLSNSISNTGGSGIASIDCDYLTADHNLISHNGYIPASTANPQWYSWTSAISFNSNQWFDTYAGFHNYISNNIIAGEVDQSSHHTDGNGIILDLSSGSYTPSTANTPPALIVNNVVYGNGGRCIVAYVVTNFWIVNNTCYENDLDTSENAFGSIEPNDSHDGYVINNIAVAYQSGHPPYEQGGTVTNAHYYANLYFGASNNFSYSDPSQFLLSDPLFLSAPVLGANQFVNALAPALLANALTLLPLSPAYGRGIDPSALAGLPAAIVSDLKAHIYTDINGKARPQGGAVDLGAYQH
ncbi:MAG: Ig-like domain-containing protein, partial [Candidatus Acidiferrum sp.]